jgi:hypothetical protein
MNENSKIPGRKPYAKPSLQQYGSIRALTQSRGNTGNGDGGGVATQKKTAL